ncbi:MAG: bifunctional 2-C-methyl-D-erythritol 4-phosphate cytidylyltransferase/2-C-methyl-D-erythritol 2,4-cyclodiphosphate synthase [Paracoccaceae bacterium]
MTNAAVIVAAGRGARAGGSVPKQYRLLAGTPVLLRTIRAFADHPAIGPVVVVVNRADDDLFEREIAPALGTRPVRRVHGGAERAQSVRAGLRALAGDDIGVVLIHDAARPLVSAALISRVVERAGTSGAAAPALLVTDTLWRADDGLIGAGVDRTGLWRAQTPQGFDFKTILAAHEVATGGETDDVEVARAAGLTVALVAGATENIKITVPEDFLRAERMLGQTMDIRTGNGFDVHAFEAGSHVTLCGIDIPHERGLRGHSDADVALHAVTDAIYGALGAGDIGVWFPPADPRWKGAASDVFLRHAVGLATKRGFAISNADCTLVCEAPRIGPHAADMRRNLARIMDVDETRLSVKATTSERLGFTGRGEGIAAMATATLLKT